jgi:hypothetical protein
MMDTILIGRPSVVASNWKSAAHTRFGASADGGASQCFYDDREFREQTNIATGRILGVACDESPEHNDHDGRSGRL